MIMMMVVMVTAVLMYGIVGYDRQGNDVSDGHAAYIIRTKLIAKSKSLCN
jgi:hypothetical protein